MSYCQVDRRQLLRGATAVALATLWEDRSFAQTNYSFKQGNFSISVVSDGFISIPGNIFAPDAAPQELVEILGRLDSQAGIVRAKTNIPVIRSKSDLILVDIGAGHRYQPSDGKLTENLRAAGVDPLNVTKVVFTHAHPDHIAATIAANSNLRFPNATYYVGASEWDFWMDPDFFRSTPAAIHDFGRGAQRDLRAIEERVVMVKPGDDIVTGLRVLDTAGHTPGHLSLEISGEEGLIITADAATSEIVSP